MAGSMPSMLGMPAWTHVCASASFTENEIEGDAYSENVELDLLLKSTGVQ